MRRSLRSPRRATVGWLAAVAGVAVALTGVSQADSSYEHRIQRLSHPLQAELTPGSWRPGCPVPLGRLRLLTVAHWDFTGRQRTGKLIVHVNAAQPLARVFRRLHELRFPIRHLSLETSYGGVDPPDNDVSGAFECRQAVPSPCSGGTGTGTWSRHAYGLAIDLNPRENPYVGCGRLRHPERQPYLDRTRLRRGMVTPAVVAAFREIGWSWGGAWTGNTKDYMHFSADNR